MSERLVKLLSAGLLVIAMVCGIFFLVSLVFFIGFGTWIDFPLFIGCFLIFGPLITIMFHLKREK